MRNPNPKLRAIARAACAAAWIAGAGVACGGAKPPSGEIRSTVSAAAKVVAIDHAARKVTLENAGGDRFDVEVSQEVKNLPQVKVGDTVELTYYESLAWSVKKAGEGAPGSSAVAAVGTAPAGEKPAGAYGAHVSLTATIAAIDLAAGTVTLKGPEGDVRTVKARDPKNLERVAVGDLVDIDYTEALAIQVRDLTKH